jgi:hypothetical protein
VNSVVRLDGALVFHPFGTGSHAPQSHSECPMVGSSSK